MPLHEYQRRAAQHIQQLRAADGRTVEVAKGLELHAADTRGGQISEYHLRAALRGHRRVQCSDQAQRIAAAQQHIARRGKLRAHQHGLGRVAVHVSVVQVLARAKQVHGLVYGGVVGGLRDHVRHGLHAAAGAREVLCQQSCLIQRGLVDGIVNPQQNANFQRLHRRTGLSIQHAPNLTEDRFRLLAKGRPPVQPATVDTAQRRTTERAGIISH